MSQPAVYILASKRHGTPYIGVTSDLLKRVYEHRHDLAEGFTKKYGAHLLVYFEMHTDMYEAIKREKPMKKWERQWKINLIESGNPAWRDLYADLLQNWIPACAGMTKL